MQCSKNGSVYSITVAAAYGSVSGIVRPSALAVLRLDKLELRRLLDWDIAGLGPAQNFIHVICRVLKSFRITQSVGHEGPPRAKSRVLKQPTCGVGIPIGGSQNEKGTTTRARADQVRKSLPSPHSPRSPG